MTATVDETILTITEDEFPEFAPKTAVPCNGWRTDIKCPHEAKFKARATCCGKILFFCEDCLLDLQVYLKKNQGEGGKCDYCGKVVTMGPGNIVYLGRIG